MTHSGLAQLLICLQYHEVAKLHTFVSSDTGVKNTLLKVWALRFNFFTQVEVLKYRLWSVIKLKKLLFGGHCYQLTESNAIIVSYKNNINIREYIIYLNLNTNSNEYTHLEHNVMKDTSKCNQRKSNKWLYLLLHLL